MGVKEIVRRYWVVATFPLLSASLIYADWNHTRLWKEEKEKEKQLQLNINYNSN